MIGREEGTKLHETTTARPGALGEQPGLGLLDMDWNYTGPATTRVGTANVDTGEPCRTRSLTHDKGGPPVADWGTRSESSQRSSTPLSNGSIFFLVIKKLKLMHRKDSIIKLVILKLN
jgi:hypothetical protein